MSLGPVGDPHQVYAQNAPVTTVKVVFVAGLYASHARGRTTINTAALRYATSLDENIPVCRCEGHCPIPCGVHLGHHQQHFEELRLSSSTVSG